MTKKISLEGLVWGGFIGEYKKPPIYIIEEPGNLKKDPIFIDDVLRKLHGKKVHITIEVK